MSITYNDLISRAEQVRDESEIGANTATRVGQLLADIIQWCQDNNADLGEYLLNFTAHLNERGGILNWFQSRIVLLKTMGSAYDDVSVGSLSDGDVYYDSQGNWIYEKSGSAAINGIHPSKGVFYVNLANQTAYQWNGTTFQVAIEGSSGSGASTVTAFEGYEVVASVGDLPEQGDPVTGYIVGTHIYIYVGENGDTADGKYQDLGELSVDPDIYQPLLTAGTGIAINGSQISVDAEVVQPATPDGTFSIRIGENVYTVNLNHTHENMAKLEKFVASNPPASMANDTIYVQVDNLNNPTEIESLWLFGCEFAGGIPDTGEPMISSPSNGSTINLGTNDGSGVSKTITVKGKHLTGDLTVAVGTGLTISYGQSTGQSSVTIPMAQALLGAQVTIAYSGSGALDDGSLVISHGGSVLSSVVVVVKGLPLGYTGLDSISGITNFITTDINGIGSTWEIDASAGSQTEKSELLVSYGNPSTLPGGTMALGAINGYWSLGGGVNASIQKTTRATIVVSFTSSGATMTIGNETINRAGSNLINRAVTIFGDNFPQADDYLLRGSIYSVKCTAGGSFNGVPAKRNSDNKEGIYDLVNDVFYPLK